MKLIFLIFTFSIVHSYKILYLMPVGSRSHRNVFDPLILKLANRNHQITVVSSYTLAKPNQNIKEIHIDKTFDSEKLSKQVFTLQKISILSAVFSMKYMLAPPCVSYLQNSEVKTLIKNGKQFDIVIISSVLNECALATAPLMGNIIMMQSTTGLIPWSHSFVPRPPSFVPISSLSLGSKMNFFQRFGNSAAWLLSGLIINYDYKPYIQSVIASNLHENPSIVEAEKMISFTLTNSDPVITPAQPSMPDIVHVGGLHCKDAKSVPKEFEDFIQSSEENGFILFSLGSNVQSKHLPKEIVSGLLRAFARLKQNVIWKFEEELENLPKNVKITKWFPQQDLLGHPKIQLFITHGGMLSLQESVYNAVPVVAVPFFADQPGNVARIEEIGIGVKLDLQNISEASVYDAISEVLGNKKYKENMKKYSPIFRSFASNQLDKAVYWIEYVIRHNNATHFKSYGQELNIFQYFLLDVACVLLFLIFILTWGLIKFLKIAIKCGEKNNNE